MSLHRVSSMSSYEQARGSSPSRSEHRKMSFNPAGSWGPAAKEEPIGAFEISKGRRIRKQSTSPGRELRSILTKYTSEQVAIAILYCLLSAGVVFGYAALKPVLVEEGVYREYCSDEEVSIRERTCYEQEIRYSVQPMIVKEAC